MIDRAEKAGFGVAVAGHAALLAALTLGLANWEPVVPDSNAIEVSFVDEVGLVSAAPQLSREPPAQGVAPALGAPDDSAAALPDPTPSVPQPQRPTPQPVPRAEQPVRERPTPTQPRTTGTGEQARRPRIGDEILRGIGRDPSRSRSQNPPAAVMSQQAAADIASAIARQVQPCADRQVYPGPGAERIVTTLTLRLNRNGSLAAAPRMVRQRGVDEENRRYAQRVADLAIRSFVECAPLRGLPDDLYDVPRGWSNFTMNYRLPG